MVTKWSYAVVEALWDNCGLAVSRANASIPARLFHLFLRNMFGKMRHHVAHVVLGAGLVSYNFFRFGHSRAAWTEHFWEVAAPLIWGLCLAVVWHSVASCIELIRLIRAETEGGVVEVKSNILDPNARAFTVLRESPNPPDWFRLKAWLTASSLIGIALLCSWLVYQEANTESSQLAVEVPVVHIEPERDIVWSTQPGQTLGTFSVLLHNTGVPVDVIEVDKKYFLAQRSTSIILKRLASVIHAHKGKLGHDASFQLSLDFNPLMSDISEVSANFTEGPSLPGVYVVASYRRHSDGSSFQIATAFGSFVVPYGVAKTAKAVAIFTEKTTMDQPSPDPRRIQSLALSEVIPYLALSERWISITKEISVGADGKVHIKQY